MQQRDQILMLRPATPADLPAINAIYNHYVLCSTCTYQTEPTTSAERETWFAARGPEHPVIVAELGGEIVGWGALSRFHPRAAYARTVENALYVRHDLLRMGVGSTLLEELLRRAEALGHHVVVALIDAEQTGSIALHERHGFTRAGHLREVGFKLGRWLDVIYMQRVLGG